MSGSSPNPSWLHAALAEPTGEPSSSRLVMFLWAIILIPCFVAWGTWEAYHTNRLPDVSGWATFLGFAQAGGAVPYVFNQLRRAASERPHA